MPPPPPQRRQLRRHFLSLANGSIQLKTAPSIFFKPAKHNSNTQKLMEQTALAMNEKYPLLPGDESDAEEHERRAGSSGKGDREERIERGDGDRDDDAMVDVVEEDVGEGAGVIDAGDAGDAEMAEAE